MSQTLNLDFNTLFWLVTFGVFAGNVITSAVSLVLAICVKVGASIIVRLFGDSDERS